MREDGSTKSMPLANDISLIQNILIITHVVYFIMQWGGSTLMMVHVATCWDILVVVVLTDFNLTKLLQTFNHKLLNSPSLCPLSEN